MNTQQEIKSFYIPRLYTDTTEQYVKQIFNKACIGMPYRVDFSPYGKSSGFKEDTRYFDYKSAFVHFHLFYDGADSVISFEGLHAGMFQTIELEPYWRILKNRNPVSTTMMNCHQIVANCCVLEERVAQLEKDKEYDSRTITLMTTRISLLESCLSKLSDFILDDVSPRIRKICAEEQDQDEDFDLGSESTHSSMPSLESVSPTLEEVCWDDSVGPIPYEIVSAEDFFQDGEEIDDSSVEECVEECDEEGDEE